MPSQMRGQRRIYIQGCGEMSAGKSKSDNPEKDGERKPQGDKTDGPKSNCQIRRKKIQS